MRAFIDVDLQECLRRVTEENTTHYKAENETLGALLGKLQLLTDGMERRDFAVEQELETSAGQEPEP